MAKIVKQAKADIYLRDTDSQSLFNNNGELSFQYFHEWNDCYNSTTGKTAQIDGETYDEATGSYKPNCPEGYLPVFNGRQSALWDNMVSCFPDKIQSMYVNMRSNGLSYKDMLAKYKEFWSYWCENLYNADAFGYANTGFFEKSFGDKLQMMDYFFQKRQRYLDSKYCCGSSVNNHLRMRLTEEGKGLAIKYYQAIYSSLQWGIGSFTTQRNIEPGTYSYQPWGAKNPQDATFDIDDADLITELSTYTKNGSEYIITGLEGIGDFRFNGGMELLKRLTKFVMNYTVSKPNTNERGADFDLSSMTLLKQVIIRNVKNLTKSIVINSDVIEEIDFTGTPIVGVTTPPSDSLTKLVLPDTITSLKLKGYTNLLSNNLQIKGYSNINEFEVEDCPNINSFELLIQCFDAGAPLSEVTLTGINWNLDSLDLLLYLAQKKANIKGKITLDSSINVTLNNKIILLSAFGNIDDPNNSLYISYTRNELESVTINGRNYLDKKGDYSYILNTIPGNGNNIVSTLWSIENNNFATINQQGVVSLITVGNKETDDKATITLSITTSNGSVLTASKEIHFYKRDCEIGDYLFSDGTYSNSLYDNPKCSPIGIVFYIELDRKKALAVALKDISNNDYNNCWGLSPSAFPDIMLNEYKEAVYDISDIDNITTVNVDISKDTMLNSSGFIKYPVKHSLGNIGFISITSDIYNKLHYYLKKVGKGIGDYISKGQLETLYIIKHRDSILSDSNINLPIPKSQDNVSEQEVLQSYIKSVIISHDNSNKYSAYYYPLASYSYSYVPKIKEDEILDESVGLHHWFLPSSGELARIIFYEKATKENDTPYNIFKDSIDKSIFTFLLDNTSYYPNHSSSSEVNASQFVCLNDMRKYSLTFKTKDINHISIIRPIVEINI